MSTCTHLQASDIRPPRPTDSVYREDCTLCFDSIDDSDGLDVCLHCYNGGCAGSRQHSAQHASEAKHPLALNIRRTRKRKYDDEPPQKISKLAIVAETEADKYETVTSLKCLQCGVADLPAKDKVEDTISGIMKASTFAQQEEVKAWEMELTPCEHTLCLEQEPSRIIPSGELGHCNQCELNENLWLCLTCGNLGCGRKQFGNVGPKGNGHQLDHNKSTGHPVAVKLGSITAEGNADIYCYACDEERVDTELVAHLAHWNIDIAGRVKTEKTLTEMNLEQNLRHDFSMTTADGELLKSLFGPGLTGLKNLGNSCYLNSILQALFANDEFAKRYYRPHEKVSASGKPAEDLETQLRKMADGLLSGRYSKPDHTQRGNVEKKDEQVWQHGLAPAMLKHLIGKGHQEFSTMRQQDSFELLLHLLKLVTRSQQAASSLYADVSDPVEAFSFAMEQKLQCLSCQKVRYREDRMENISVGVPIKRIKHEDVPMTNGHTEQTTTETKDEFETVTLQQCLDTFTAPEIVELDCPACGGKSFSKQTLFKTFPTIMAINARRFEVVNWVPTKQDVAVLVNDDVIDFEAYRSKGQQEGEELLPDDATPAKKQFMANAAALDQLMAMGFPKVRCEKALHATGNDSADMAMAWLFEHMEDSDIDEPLDLGGASTVVIDPASIEGLGQMGFSAPQARQALKETHGDMERAVDWLFSHPDAAGDFGDEQSDGPAPEDATAVPTANARDTQPAIFKLQSIVCHKGSSIHAGHYVAYVKKAVDEAAQEDWVLFNDEKVAHGGNAAEMVKFAYVYFFRRASA